MATTPIHVFAKWKVKEEHILIVEGLLKELHTKTTREEGNLFYQIHRSQTDPNTLLIFEGYASAEAQQAHTNAGHFKDLAVGRIIPLLLEREVLLAIPLDL